MIPHLNSPHGRPATFSGANGTLHPQAQERAVTEAFANLGTKGEGGVKEIPAEAKAGAFECDESCREYTGDKHDAAGSRGIPAQDHNNPHQAGSIPAKRAQ